MSPCRLIIPCVALLLGCAQAAPPAARDAAAPLTVADARNLPVPELARALLGDRLVARVIEAERTDYQPGGAPLQVAFFTQPVVPWPRINRICRTDVITIEYDWFEPGRERAAAPIGIARISATARYLAFPDPDGEPGTPEYDRAHEAACAAMRSGREAFRAPDAGDAQWLAALETHWRRAGVTRQTRFACSDYADASCASAVLALPRLTLARAARVEAVDCPAGTRGWFANCYRLTFMRPDGEHPEWVMTVTGFIRDGSAPVELGTLHLVHVEPPIVMH